MAYFGVSPAASCVLKNFGNIFCVSLHQVPPKSNGGLRLSVLFIPSIKLAGAV
jgi:hypothetical protein